jgi:hypothetical protein
MGSFSSFPLPYLSFATYQSPDFYSSGGDDTLRVQTWLAALGAAASNNGYARGRLPRPFTTSATSALTSAWTGGTIEIVGEADGGLILVSSAASQAALQFGTYSAAGATYITASAARGATEIQVTSTAALSVGQYVQLVVAPGPGSCQFTGSISDGTTLNVTAVEYGVLATARTLGDYTSTLLSGTTITGLGTGSGGTGTYTVSRSQTVSSETMTCYAGDGYYFRINNQIKQVVDSTHIVLARPLPVAINAAVPICGGVQFGSSFAPFLATMAMMPGRLILRNFSIDGAGAIGTNASGLLTSNLINPYIAGITITNFAATNGIGCNEQNYYEGVRRDLTAINCGQGGATAAISAASMTGTVFDNIVSKDGEGILNDWIMSSTARGMEARGSTNFRGVKFWGCADLSLDAIVGEDNALTGVDFDSCSRHIRGTNFRAVGNGNQGLLTLGAGCDDIAIHGIHAYGNGSNDVTTGGAGDLLDTNIAFTGINIDAVPGAQPGANVIIAMIAPTSVQATTTVDQVIPNGTETGVYFNAESTDALSEFTPPPAIAAAGSWTTSSTAITMSEDNPGTVTAGMAVWDATTGKAVGTVSSWPTSSTTLTLTAAASNASSGSTDNLIFGSANSYTSKTARLKRIDVELYWSAALTGLTQIIVAIGAATLKSNCLAGQVTRASFTGYLVPGQIIDVYVTQNSGSNATIKASSGTSTTQLTISDQ